MTCGNGPSSLDCTIGNLIREQRICLGLTQDQIADALGISYQQVQKYETGTNRISAGRLFELADFFGIEITRLFPDGDTTRPDNHVTGTVSTRHIIELVRRFSRIENERIRTGIMALVRSITEDDTDRPRQHN